MSIIKKPSSLSEQVTVALQHYFETLEDETPCDLYQSVITAVEIPLLKKVLEVSNNNRSKAADTLGINRATLRKKILQYSHQLSEYHK